ncbi:hypothetical protein ACET3Z_024488 [Daucus carota]
MLCKMGHQQKSLKLMKNNDVISELPDDIVSQFISLLSFKEAVRTSIVSKSWMLIWTTHKDIVCDVSNILESLSEESRDVYFLVRQDHRDKFVERVDHIMQRRCKGPKMNSIVISFPLSNEHESHITNWISRAVMMGVEKISLDLTGGFGFVTSDVPRAYSFPLAVLISPGKACSVKHLQLASCSLDSLSISNSLASLVTLELQNVNLTDQQLDIMLCNCSFLEKLVLKSCTELVNFKLTNRSSRLRFLSIKSCCRLNYFELDAENLEIFEYTGQIDRFMFKHVPKLAEVYFCFCGSSRVESAIYALSQLANDIPQLKILNMVWIRVNLAFQLPEGVPTFINIKHLVLTVFPFLDEDKLGWITFILKAAPFLKNLQLNQFISSFTRQSEVHDRQLPEVTHMNLREIEINGYQGNYHEKELLKYLVNSAVKLDLLVISPQVKVYKGLNDWWYEDLNFPGDKLSLEKIEELHSMVPKAIRVRII